MTARRTAPTPRPGEAVIQPLRLGISRLDRDAASHGFEGVLGHEFVGVVQSIHGGDPGKLIGKRVVGAINTCCGECDLCARGMSVHCRRRTLLGLDGRDGCFSDTFTLPASNLVVVPNAVDNDHAVFAHVLASALQAARQLTIEGKPYITVLGDGPLGLLTVQIMAKLNASVRLIGKHSEKLGLCEKWGIKHRHLDDIGRRADQDVVVDCTGSPAGLVVASQLVRPRGKILLKTMYPHEAAPSLLTIVRNEIEIIGSSFGPISEAITLLTHREIDVVSLISRRVRFGDAESAWQAAASPGMLKVLMECRSDAAKAA